MARVREPYSAVLTFLETAHHRRRDAWWLITNVEVSRDAHGDRGFGRLYIVPVMNPLLAKHLKVGE